MTERKPYPTDLSDEQWVTIETLRQKCDLGRRKPIHSHREMFDVVLYLNRTGCQWRMLLHDFSARKPVYAFWHRLADRDALIVINDALRTEIRLRDEREADPSVVIVDSQSVQTV